MHRLAVTALILCGCTETASEPPADTPRPRLQVTGQLESDEILEASGLARSQRDPGLLWTMNDGGSKPRLFAFDGAGFPRGRIKLEDAKNKDWEDLSSFTVNGEPYLLVADTGDNDADRKHVSLYVVPEPDLAEDDKVKIEPERRIRFRYPDGPRDVEAVAIDAENERVLLLSKRDLPPILYELSLRPGNEDDLIATWLGPIESLPSPRRQDVEKAVFTKDWHWQPTGMDLSPDGKLAVILTYRAVYVFRRHPGQSLYESLSGQAYALGLGHFRDAESVAFSADSEAIYVTLEGRHAPLLRIDVSGALPE